MQIQIRSAGEFALSSSMSHYAYAETLLTLSDEPSTTFYVSPFYWILTKCQANMGPSIIALHKARVCTSMEGELIGCFFHPDMCMSII